MASEKQIAANRANSQKSTGPRTAEGKTISSRNAVQHGLTGRLLYLSEPDQLLYAQLGKRLIEENQPMGAIEEELLKTIQDCHWQLNTIRVLSEQTLARLLDGAATSSTAASPALTLDQLGRYEISIQRSLNGAINQLRRSQKERKEQEHKEQVWRFEQQNRRPFNPKYDRVRAPNGFVLQEDAPYLAYQAAEQEILGRWAARNREATPESIPNPPEPAAPAA